RRRHTRLVSDWSSDVCSSDLSSTIDFSPGPLLHGGAQIDRRTGGSIPATGDLSIPVFSCRRRFGFVWRQSPRAIPTGGRLFCLDVPVGGAFKYARSGAVPHTAWY